MCSSHPETSSAASVLPRGRARMEPSTKATTTNAKTASSRSAGRRTRSAPMRPRAGGTRTGTACAGTACAGRPAASGTACAGVAFAPAPLTTASGPRGSSPVPVTMTCRSPNIARQIRSDPLADCTVPSRVEATELAGQAAGELSRAGLSPAGTGPGRSGLRLQEEVHRLAADGFRLVVRLDPRGDRGAPAASGAAEPAAEPAARDVVGDVAVLHPLLELGQGG